MNTTWSRFNITSIVLGFAFLYLPIVLLIVFSFNESKLVTVWGGFSTKWYVSLFHNQGLMDATWVTARVGVISATVATVLGTLAVKTFCQITLPVFRPAIISGWMLAFTLSLDDLVIASFTSGPGATTLPMKIYSQVRLGVTPEINAACTILIAVVAVGVIIA